MMVHRGIVINKKFYGDKEAFNEQFLEAFFHSVPQMMFVSVPLVALVLQLLYIRRRKLFFYEDHVIMIVHIYIAAFIAILVYYGFSGLQTITEFSVFKWLGYTVIGYIFFYCFAAMYKFYGQGIFKTFIKYFILLFVCGIIASLLMITFFIKSLLQI